MNLVCLCLKKGNKIPMPEGYTGFFGEGSNEILAKVR